MEVNRMKRDRYIVGECLLVKRHNGRRGYEKVVYIIMFA